MKASRLIPLVVLVFVAGLLLVLYLPRTVRYFSFRGALNDMVRLVKEGDPVAAAKYVEDVDYEDLIELIETRVPPDYHQDMVALNVTSATWDGECYNVRLVARFQGQRYNGIGQAKMKWHRTDQGWRFNLRDTMVAEGYPQGSFVSLEHYLGSSELFRH